jgi:transposase
MPDAATERELMDRLWDRVRPLLPPPPPKGGRPFADDRACFEGIVYLLRNGLRWRQMPDCYPSGVTCWRRHRDWTEAGVWHRVWKLVLRELDEAGKLDTSELVMDGTFIEAKKGASGSARAARGAGPRSKSSPIGRASRSGRRPTRPTSTRSTSARPPSPTSR